MNRTILLLSVIVLAVGATSAYLWLQLQREYELRQVSQTRAAELEERLKLMAVEEPGVPSHSDTRALTADPMSAPLPALAARQPKPVASNDEDRLTERSHDAPESPEVRAMKLAEQKAWVRRKFPDLAAALHLQEEEADKLVSLLAEQQLRFDENPPSVPEGELEWDVNNKPEWLRNMEEEEQRRRDKEIAELLGEAKFRAWQDYAYAREARRLVRQLGTMLDGTLDSLHEDQMPSLIRAIAEMQHRYGAVSTDAVTMVYIPDPKNGIQRMPTPIERAAAAKRELERFAKYNEHLREAAAPYLSTRQLARLDQMLDEQLDMMRDHVNKLRAQAERRARQ